MAGFAPVESVTQNIKKLEVHLRNLNVKVKIVLLCQLSSVLQSLTIVEGIVIKQIKMKTTLLPVKSQLFFKRRRKT